MAVPPLMVPELKTLPVPETLMPLLTVPALMIVLCALPVTLKVWLIVAPALLTIKLVPSPETVTPLLSVPPLSIVFWLPVTLKV
jgi:hypothetical protein